MVDKTKILVVGDYSDNKVISILVQKLEEHDFKVVQQVVNNKICGVSATSLISDSMIEALKKETEEYVETRVNRNNFRGGSRGKGGKTKYLRK